MKLRSASLDDAHLEMLSWLDDLNRPWTSSLRVGVNALYRIHRSILIRLIRFCCKRSIHTIPRGKRTRKEDPCSWHRTADRH
jgi:hypothetical protein